MKYPRFTKLSVIPAHYSSMTILYSLFSPKSPLLPSLAFLRLFLYTLSHYLLSVFSPLIMFCFQSKQHLFFSPCRIFISVSSLRASTWQFWDVPSDLKHLTNVHIILWLCCSVDIMFTRNSALRIPISGVTKCVTKFLTLSKSPHCDSVKKFVTHFVTPEIWTLSPNML